MNIGIFGTGYVGLVSGLCFAKIGNKVTFYDVDNKKIDTLIKGNVPFYEPGLEELLTSQQKKNRLKFVTLNEQTSLNEDVYFICVGTPNKTNGSTNLSFVERAIKTIAKRTISNKVTIFTKSTVPVGTTSSLDKKFSSYFVNRKVFFGSNPEFLAEGSAIKDFMTAERIVIGGDHLYIKKIAKQIYSKLLKKSKLLFMTRESAELTKYAANAMLATRISFINEIARFSTKMNANIHDVRDAIGFDKRIGKSFLNPGIGFGGSCFPKDTSSLIMQAKEQGIRLPIAEGVREINQSQFKYYINRFIKLLPAGITIALFGVTFKPGTDDTRESIGLKIANFLIKKGFSLEIYDPFIKSKKFISGEIIDESSFRICSSLDQALSRSDALVICNEDFLKMNPNKRLLQQVDYVFDGRNVISQKDISSNCRLIQIGL